MLQRHAYKSLEIYNLSKQLVVACYELTSDLPSEEKTNLTLFIRNASLTVYLNIAQGAFLKTKKKKKFIRSAQNALIVIDAATEALVATGFKKEDQINGVVVLSSACYQLLEQLW
jgi:four helix bundle protein